MKITLNRKFLRRFIRIGVFLLFLDILVSVIYFYSVQNYFYGKTIRHCDAGVVFFAGFTKSGTLDYECHKRLNKILSYYYSGIIDRIVCVGGSRPVSKLFGSKMMKDFLKERKVPGDSIFIDTVSFNTRANFNEACRMIHYYNWKNVMLVSSNLHLFRISSLEAYCSKVHFTYPNRKDKIENLRELIYTWCTIHHEWAKFLIRAVIPEKHINTLVRKLRRC